MSETLQYVVVGAISLALLVTMAFYAFLSLASEEGYLSRLERWLREGRG